MKTNLISRLAPRKRIVLAGTLLATLPVLALPSSAQTTLNGAGATFPYPLYTKWFDAYKKQTGVQINYQAIGSGGGIQQLKNKTVDFGASDAPLSNADLAGISGKVVQIPTVAGTVVLAYNGLPAGLKLTGPVIADIFLGNIKRWNDSKIAGINPGMSLPNRAIAVARRSDGSGTTAIFTNYLAAVSPAWKSRVGAGKSVDWPVGLGGRGNDGVAAIVKSTPGGIGYVELAYAKQNRMPYAAVQNKSGAFISPSSGSGSAAAAAGAKATARDVRAPIVNLGGRAYPITGYTYIMYYAENARTPRGKQVVNFLKWAMGPGQRMAPSLDYAPLPKAVVSINRSKLR